MEVFCSHLWYNSKMEALAKMENNYFKPDPDPFPTL